MEKIIKKYIARFLIEAETPLFVGSGKSSLLKDALVQKDANGFPMIPGTSLAGVLRHSFRKSEHGENLNRIFGSSKGENSGTGALLKVSPALMMLDQNKVSEGLIHDEKWNGLKKIFDQLPVRQHVRINDKGVAEDGGLFDNEVIFKGTRFVFELELTSHREEEPAWATIINLVQNPEFRIGAGTRNGYGSLKVLKLFSKEFDLARDLQDYLDFSPSFDALNWEAIKAPMNDPNGGALTKVHYTLKLTPDPFFIFGSGYGDNDVDNTPLEEEVAVYGHNGIVLEKQTVIPASSIKGAISHRVAFHYNKNSNFFAGMEEAKTGINNDAVVAVFGKAGKDIADPAAGKVFIKDIYLIDKEVRNDKILNHVAIDRFTGGAMDGALFSEKVSQLKKDLLEIEIQMDKGLEEKYIKALEASLEDICKGLLPLGGMTTKGHGIFTGELLKDNKVIFPN